MGSTYIMGRVLGRRVVQRHVLDRVGRAHDLGGSVLALGRPHDQAGEEAAVAVLELAEGVRDVAPIGQALLVSI